MAIRDGFEELLRGEERDSATSPLDEERKRPRRTAGPRLVVPRVLRIHRGLWTCEIEPSAADMAKVGAIPMAQIGYRGITWPALRRIGIARGLDPYMTEMVMLHELLHACFPVRKPLCSVTVEERIVTNIAPVLLQVLKQCKWKVTREKANRRSVRRVRSSRRNKAARKTRRVVHPRRGR